MAGHLGYRGNRGCLLDQLELLEGGSEVENIPQPSDSVADSGGDKGHRLAVTYDNVSVESVSRLIDTIRNTGTQGISGAMFTDGPIRFMAAAEGDETQLLQNIPLLLRVLDISPTRQKEAELAILNRGNPASFSYKPSLINKEGSVQLEVLLS